MPAAPLSTFALLSLRVMPHEMAHSPAYFLVFWAAAFVSLCLAVAGLNIFSNLIGSDFELMSLGKEAVLAGVASAIEAVSVWLILALCFGRVSPGDSDPADHRWVGLPGGPL